MVFGGKLQVAVLSCGIDAFVLSAFVNSQLFDTLATDTTKSIATIYTESPEARKDIIQLLLYG